MKTCYVCGREKKFESFGRNNQYSDGLQRMCKICKNDRQRNYMKKRGRPRKQNSNEKIDTKFRLVNPTKNDWCLMWSLLTEIGYDVNKNIHEQFAEKYKVPVKVKPPEKPNAYIPSQCE